MTRARSDGLPSSPPDEPPECPVCGAELVIESDEDAEWLTCPNWPHTETDE